MRAFVLQVALLGLLLGGCPDDPRHPTKDVPDASPDPGSCEAACTTLAWLGCPEADTPPGGKSCTKLCEDVESSGHFNMRPACVAAAKSVTEARDCGTVRCKK